jgi:TatD DNase family protein
MLTDSHCHLGSDRFAPDELDALVTRAHDAGIHRLVTIATSLEDIPTNLAIAESHPNIYASVGIHPCDVQNTPEDFLPALRGFARHPKVAAIGETGLDYFHPAPEGWTEEDYHHRQREYLRNHYTLAAELNLNIVIHTRDRAGDQSFTDALNIYQDFASDVRAVFHCFPGPYSQAQRVLDLGGLVSFTGIATFKKADAVLEAAVKTSAGQLMVETDSPYLSPVPHRGKRCEPAFVRHTAEAIATARNESLADFANHTESTANQFFRFQI